MRRTAAALILLTWFHLVGAAGIEFDIVEEILAVVDETPILRSDLALARAVELLPRADDETDGSWDGRLLAARIELEIQFRDLESTGVVSRLDIDLDRAQDALAARAGGTQTVLAKLAAQGLGEPDLQSLSLRVAAVNAYVEQRLRPRVSVSFEEVEAAYRGELAQQMRAAGQPLPTLAEVSAQLHRLLSERKLNQEIASWVEEARERQQITRFAP